MFKIYLDNCCYNRPFDDLTVGNNGFDEIKTLIAEIMTTGIRPKDAAHLACALISDCDYFITTDKRLLKYKTNKMKLINPIEFVEMWRAL